jgi:hypothetical protein
VDPVPKAKQDLPYSTAKAARRILTDKQGNYAGSGVLRAKPEGGGVTLGMPSTVRTCPRMLLPTSGPNSKRPPKSPKPGPQNLCCRRPLPTNTQKQLQVAARELADLRRKHAKLVGYGRERSLNELTNMLLAYQYLRRKFVAEHPQLVDQLEKLELAHKLARGHHKIARQVKG